MLWVLIRSTSARRSTHNICFHAEIRKILCGYPLLSVAMVSRYIFSYFSMKTYVVDTHLKRFSKALLMNTHNICFYGETRKNLSTPLDYKILKCLEWSSAFRSDMNRIASLQESWLFLLIMWVVFTWQTSYWCFSLLHPLGKFSRQQIDIFLLATEIRFCISSMLTYFLWKLIKLDCSLLQILLGALTLVLLNKLRSHTHF